MIDNFQGKTAVLTGAGSGFGRECARLGARWGMQLVLVDVQQDALDAAAAEAQAAGVPVLARRVDVSDAAQMQALADAVAERFGAPHFDFNNAGVATAGLLWEGLGPAWTFGASAVFSALALLGLAAWVRGAAPGRRAPPR